MCLSTFPSSNLLLFLRAPAAWRPPDGTAAGNRYDWFLVSPDLASEEAETCRIITFAGDDLAIAKKVSDHMPVMATFKTDAKFRDRKPN